MLRLGVFMLIVTVALATVFCMSALAEDGVRDVSQTVWYQGFLADVDTGEPVNTSLAVVASIYDQAIGGTMLWGTESHMGTVVTEGWFNIELGYAVPLIGFMDPPYYLELTIGGELLEPRQKLASVPMSLRSAAADSGDGDWIESGGALYRATGNVGIGTMVPGSDLHIRRDGDTAVGISIDNRDTGAYSSERIDFQNEAGTLAYIACYDSDSPSHSATMLIANNRPRGRIALKASGHSAVVVDSTGNVGIGVSSPASELDVSGTAEMLGFKLTTSPTAGHVLTSDSAGNGTWQAPPDAGGTGILVDVHSETATETIGSAAMQYGGTEVTLTVPGPGYIICTSTVRVTLNHANNSVSDHLILNHSESVSSTGDLATLVSHWVLPTEQIGPVYRSFSLHSTHQISMAGTYTYYLVGRMGSGADASDEFNNAQMTAIYYPN